MKNKIITNFKAVINNTTFNDETLYYRTANILSTIEELFGECYNDTFVEDLSDMLYHIDGSNAPDATEIILGDFYQSPYDAETFESIEFTSSFAEDEDYVKDMNYNLKKGYYSKEK